jgi:hypothetical protein
MLTEYSTYQTAIDLKDLRYMGTEGVKTRRSVVDDQIEQLPFHKDLFNMEDFKVMHDSKSIAQLMNI